MESWRVSRTVVADSHRFDGEQDSDPHESVGSGPHLSETLVADPYQIYADPQTLSVVLML
jgi:hypothetical protein